MQYSAFNVNVDRVFKNNSGEFQKKVQLQLLCERIKFLLLSDFVLF